MIFTQLEWMNWKLNYLDQFKDPYLMNRMMLHGNGQAINLVSESCMYFLNLLNYQKRTKIQFDSFFCAVFVNFLPTKANQVLNVILYRPSLRWLYLLVLFAVLPIKRKSHPLLDNWIIQFAFIQYVNRIGSSEIIWHIK